MLNGIVIDLIWKFRQISYPKVASIILPYNKNPEYQKVRELIANAKATGSKTYFSGQLCRYGHIAERYTRSRNCVDCSNDKQMRELRKLEIRGITKEDYDQLTIDQENKCAICKNKLGEGQDVNLDHCHISDKVRGILCRWCNMGLGLFRDKIKSLRNAADYLENFEKSNFKCEEE